MYKHKYASVFTHVHLCAGNFSPITVPDCHTELHLLDQSVGKDNTWAEPCKNLPACSLGDLEGIHPLQFPLCAIFFFLRWEWKVRLLLPLIWYFIDPNIGRLSFHYAVGVFCSWAQRTKALQRCFLSSMQLLTVTIFGVQAKLQGSAATLKTLTDESVLTPGGWPPLY